MRDAQEIGSVLTDHGSRITVHALRVPRIDPKVGDIDAEQSAGGAPALVEGDVEQQVFVAIDREPSVCGNLRFELSCFPAGVTERNHCRARSFATRHRRQDIARRGDMNPFRNFHAVFPAAARPVNHEALFGLNRAALQDRLAFDADIGARKLQLLEDLSEMHLRGPIDNDAHSALIAMLEDVSDCLREIGICHSGHGDQKLINERVAGCHGGSIAGSGAS
jgi:hypothetical protein